MTFPEARMTLDSLYDERVDHRFKGLPRTRRG